jgi:dihydrofolate synthase/folylpolyglutamate synthase
VVVLEAGMGGRLDSTNIIRNPLLSVITGIALDHVAFLGDTVEKIAAEKAGIIKDEAPVLFGGDDASAAAVIRRRAEEYGSSFHTVPYESLDNLRFTLSGTSFDLGERKDLLIHLLGDYQPRNASLVVRAVDLLRGRGLSISEEALREGLADARWPGRFEIIAREPLMIFDGAHNPQGIRSAVASIHRYFGEEKVYLLTGVLRDKDYTAIAADLSTVASRAFTLTPDSPRALSAADYAKTLRSAGMEAEAFESLRDALSAAWAAAKADGVPLICLGSLYVYASLIVEVERLNEENNR